MAVCLSLVAFPHYCTDPDITWRNGRGCPLVVHYCVDLQLVHRFRCYDNRHVCKLIAHCKCVWCWTQNVSECLYSHMPGCYCQKPVEECSWLRELRIKRVDVQCACIWLQCNDCVRTWLSSHSYHFVWTVCCVILSAAEHGNIEALIKLGIAYLYNEGCKYHNAMWQWCQCIIHKWHVSS